MGQKVGEGHELELVQIGRVGHRVSALEMPTISMATWHW